MGSVERDELNYDGGSYGASQEQIDMEHADRRRQAREQVEARLAAGHQGTLDQISDMCWQDWDVAVMLLTAGNREEAMTRWTEATERAIERVIDWEFA